MGGSGGGIRLAAEFTFVVIILGKLLAFSYLLCLLPLLLQGIKHDPAQLLDVMLLPS